MRVRVGVRVRVRVRARVRARVRVRVHLAPVEEVLRLEAVLELLQLQPQLLLVLRVLPHRVGRAGLP